jgi:hypothetical protein
MSLATPMTKNETTQDQHLGDGRSSTRAHKEREGGDEEHQCFGIGKSHHNAVEEHSRGTGSLTLGETRRKVCSVPNPLNPQVYQEP